MASRYTGIKLYVGTAITGHSHYVKNSKRQSRHVDGLAVDVSMLDNTAYGYKRPLFTQLGNRVKDYLVTLGYRWNVESGNDRAVLWQTSIGGNHYNHLHISNRIR